MQKDRIYKFIISGGGTGGHIFPAIAIANAIKSKYNTAEILFVGSKDRMEMQKVPAAGYEITGLWISGLERKLSLKNLMFPFKVITSVLKSLVIIKRFKPDAVIGVGGYASGPLLYAAHLKGIPSLIQEQNSFPGITNKILAGKVSKICVAYENMNKFFPVSKIIITGNPVRQELLDISGKREQAFSFFNLNPDKKTILVVGGSLGARTINESIKNSIESYANNDIQLIWQTGKYYFPNALKVAEQYKDRGIRVYDFITSMDLAYAAADIVISRAGAIAISEISLLKKPVILVPSPNVAEDHQTKNALALSDKNAAILVKDSDANKDLVRTSIELINDKEKMNCLSSNIGDFSVSNSADIIAEEIFKLVNI
ncbi:MAG: undecaprenyldiphospho-muramoylpentapeptide beta-N-acetylglucosaminyltransferase [Bacteroidota bacterium]|nr:undecaprenyldiphospho-muramoylpentapeptide beta-N-acetylglucosaminyltransferase [Bacteroidota bacterium]